MQTDDKARTELLEVWGTLTAFQRDILSVISDVDDVPYGLQIKDELEEYRGERVLHGRLYPVLDELAGDDLLVKSKRDDRTNEYDLTARGVAVLSAAADRLNTARTTPQDVSIESVLESGLYE